MLALVLGVVSALAAASTAQTAWAQPLVRSQVWAWGYNVFGQVGDGTTTSSITPVQVAQGAMPAGTRVVAISAGGNHTVALDANGQAWTWGQNNSGQLGDGSTTSRTAPVQVAQGAIPAGTKLIAVAAAVGGEHTVALDADGRAWAWGNNSFGQLGDGSTANSTVPVQVAQGAMPSGTKLTAVFAGRFHTLALDTNGRMWAWGNNFYGQLGDGTTATRTSPVQVTDGAMPSGTKLVAVSAGWGHTVALDSEGHAWAWGNNAYGQLGNGTHTGAVTPVQVVQGAIPDGTRLTRISAGSFHTVVLSDDGHAWAWGDNYDGEVGDGTGIDRSSPVAVVQGAMPEGTKLIAIACGDFHTMALDEDGQAWGWGYNLDSQLGDGTYTSRTSPVRTSQEEMPDGTRLVAIAAGLHHSVALSESVDHPPTVEVAPGGQVVSDSAGTVNLVVGDAETPAGELTVSAASDDQSVVPDAGISFGGSGADRTMTVRTNSQASGTAVVTVMVSDGDLTGTATVTVVTGRSRTDHLTGTDGPDLIFARDGNDVVDARGGIDLVAAGAGNDAVLGGAGDDTIDGGLGNDALVGDAGNDVLSGGAGNDGLVGGLGDDALSGGAGNDGLAGGRGADLFSGGTGNDIAIDFSAGEGDTRDGTIP
ncbi:cell wall anchor protein [Actinopolymorpha rutila]|uniref:Alpha-tubulin suppressor-like RCC1 family protein n=1 Tax=Actinopolymorpha rutila TaxID=446787 RepID=A0A852ZHW8_9ACTN|nr:alpha-tubulin suppressor-like RCC1 family protein [Actinopolymorpha rutila]